MIHSGNVRVPTGDAAKTQAGALAIAGRDIADPVGRPVKDRLLAHIAMLPLGRSRTRAHALFSVES